MSLQDGTFCIGFGTADFTPTDLLSRCLEWKAGVGVGGSQHQRDAGSFLPPNPVLCPGQGAVSFLLVSWWAGSYSIDTAERANRSSHQSIFAIEASRLSHLWCEGGLDGGCAVTDAPGRARLMSRQK